VGALSRYWYAACFGRELRRRPLARTIHGLPVVLFRDAAGRAAALVDRCPHRNAPLSLGHCEGGELRCAYHGWRFDAAGTCTEVPGLDDVPGARVRAAESLPLCERDGLVWVVPSRDDAALEAPPVLAQLERPGGTTVRHRATVRASVLAAVENALDVPHTSFLHRGLFRGGRARVPVEAIVRRVDGGVEAEYVGEPVPPGVAARLLAPEGGTVEHFDRFLLPSISQVEYRLGESFLIVTTAFTPVDDDRTMLHATVTFRSGLPAPIVAALVTPVARWILHQDARMLAAQHDNVRRFGGERFASTPIDVLGPHIARLSRRADRGEPLFLDTEGLEERVTLYT
jgi:phenylpropionate dioxygenase-like ring-hydroxylating dioxygenase large terminal subunit